MTVEDAIQGYAINGKRLQSLKKPVGNRPIYKITYEEKAANLLYF